MVAQVYNEVSKKNIIRLTPFTVVDYFAPGFGLEYERMLNEKVGLNFPFVYSFSRRTEGLFIYSENPNYYYFNPGVKFYLFNEDDIFGAIGPTLIFGCGTGYDDYEYFSKVKFRNYRMAVMFNNYLGVRFSKHVQINMELGFGLRLLSYYVFKGFGNLHYGIGPSGNIRIGIGYSF